jgi:hypothetical protein
VRIGQGLHNRLKNYYKLRKALLRAAHTLKELAPDKHEIINKYFIDLGWDLGFGREHMKHIFTKRIKYAPEEED